MRFNIKRKLITILDEDIGIERYLATDEQIENFEKEFPNVPFFVSEELDVSISFEEYKQMLKKHLESYGVRFD